MEKRYFPVTKCVSNTTLVMCIRRVLIWVPNSQLTTIFSAKYQLTNNFFGQYSVNYLFW